MGHSREQIIDISNAIADEFGVNRLAMLACAVAESDLVWNARRPRTAAEDTGFWPDVSSGVWQQTVRWSREYQEAGFDMASGPWPGQELVDQVLDTYNDPWHAGRVAAPQIREKLEQEGGNVLNALCRYNWPAQDPHLNPNRSNYARGIGTAQAILNTVRGDADPERLADLRPAMLDEARKYDGWSYVWGGKSPQSGFDCSGLVAWASTVVGLPIRSYTDHIFEDTEPCEDPGPGDVVLYEGPGQPGCRFPHVEFYIDANTSFGSRGGVGVGEHPLHIPGLRPYYRRIPGALAGEDPNMREELNRFIGAVAYLGDDVADKIERTRASLDDDVERPHPDMSPDDLRRNLEQAFANIDRVYKELGDEGKELRRVREEFVGARP